MEALDYFTCIAYDTVDFLIQSKYVVFGLYLAVEKGERSIIFNREQLPHVNIGFFLEKAFVCKSSEDCNTVLIMRRSDFPESVQEQIQKYTGTDFPASGNFAISVNSLISSKALDISSLHLIPKGIRKVQEKSGVVAIAFASGEKKNEFRRQILLSPDNLLQRLFAGQKEGEK
ncbi:MAG: hypothetical protein IJT42_08515 [Treponema sp.]|nr:hypothetical protein [Treponema sp.]